MGCADGLDRRAVGGVVVAAVAERVSSVEMLQIEECDAWFEYLHATRDQGPVRYEELEPWAWTRLKTRLKAIEARRGALK